MTSAPPNGNGASRLGIYASVFMAIATMFGAIFWVAGIASDVAANKAALIALNARTDLLVSDLRTNDLLTSNITRDLREIETQFCASDIVRNLMHANDMRTTAMLWQKAYGTQFPTDNAYYPQICQRPVTAQ